MKSAKKNIPAFPKIPAMPKMPKKPQSPDASGAGIPGGAMPGGLPKMISQIMQHVGGGKGKGFSKVQIKKLIKEFPLDKYRDENGKVCCPVPKATREKIMRSLKK